MNDEKRALCVCGHDREAHAEEQPYECLCELRDDEFCGCDGFEYPRLAAALGGSEESDDGK